MVHHISICEELNSHLAHPNGIVHNVPCHNQFYIEIKEVCYTLPRSEGTVPQFVRSILNYCLNYHSFDCVSIFCNSEITRQKKEFRVQEQPIMGERSIYWCSKSNYFNCSKYSSEIPFMLLLHLLKIDKFEFTNFLNILNFGVNLRNNSSHFPIKLFHCVAESRGRCSFDIGIDIEWLIF